MKSASVSALSSLPAVIHCMSSSFDAAGWTPERHLPFITTGALQEINGRLYGSLERGAEIPADRLF
ncbi:MAG: hypothetical protein ACKO6F_08925 [Cyanobium sp.]